MPAGASRPASACTSSANAGRILANIWKPGGRPGHGKTLSPFEATEAEPVETTSSPPATTKRNRGDPWAIVHRTLHAQDPAGILEVEAAVAGAWFSLPDTVWDRDTSDVVIPWSPGQPAKFMIFKAERAPNWFDRRLVIHHVLDMAIEDEAQIGHYDIKRMALEERRDGELGLLIESGFPLWIRFHLSRVCVELWS